MVNCSSGTMAEGPERRVCAGGHFPGTFGVTCDNQQVKRTGEYVECYRCYHEKATGLLETGTAVI